MNVAALMPRTSTPKAGSALSCTGCAVGGLVAGGAAALSASTWASHARYSATASRKGVAFQPFVDALKDAIAGLPGPTLLVGSAELSHVGPAYGDKVQLAGDAPEVEANRRKVIEQDQALMKMLTDNKPQDLVSSLAWQQNPTRWSSVGAIAATMLAADPNEVRLLQYGGTMDPQGTAMISAASLAMF